ncbi:proline and serine-rich protein 3 isoform X2 [Thalassophryne amazonica]|uniref:proline and serine-rich protein 3 isoform X2 n=1 Tax=Thalassophryne amazonica TaxID=390379 RepID=UPI001471DE23|nr:proline and serine-rich protein 3 isoform X2 [Thalassophryne amazonica]
MKSSDAVFTKQNPFCRKSPLGKTHYHPSCVRSLSKTKKKTSLSPVHLNKQGRPQSHTVGQETQQQFDKLDGQSTVSESWPVNNCRLSPDSDMVLSAMVPQKLSVAARNTKESSDLDIQESSLLARYIEHFRHGHAPSQEACQQLVSATGEEQGPPWHISPSSSTPTKSSKKDVVVTIKDDHLSASEHCQHDSTSSPCRGSLSILSDMSSWEFDDTEIQHIQEKASRLLQRSDWPVSDASVPVSPDILGCCGCSSSLSVDEPVKRPFISSNFPKKSTAGTVKPSSGSIQAGSNSKSSAIPSFVPPTCPEEDILFQWRLRRKMEQAGECPQSHQQASTYGSTFSLQGPSQHHPSASGQRSKDFQPPESSKPQIKETLRPCPPASSHPPFPAFVVSDFSVSQPQTVVHVPPHMHFLCDVLPCPIQSSRLVEQERISQRLDEYPTYPTTTVPKKTPVTDTSTDEHISKLTTPPAPASSGGVEEQQPSHQKRAEKDKNTKARSKETEKNEKKVTSFRKQKKSSRCTVELTGVQKLSNKSSSHHTATKKAKPQTEQHQKEKCSRFSSETCSRDHAPPSSPVHSALGQVVSEVLFATVDTAPTHNTPVTSLAPVCAASAPSQPSASLNDTQNSLEVISQLLQEAEDSDEKEFESDPLLQVLRKQRKWVKEQISEVNSLLEEFLFEEQAA